jgi:ankyrin repeat protein
LAYNADQPISSLNTPHLFISDRCEQTIYAFKNYTASGGQSESCKDFIDLVRYLLEHGADFIGKGDLKDHGVLTPY